MVVGMCRKSVFFIEPVHFGGVVIAALMTLSPDRGSRCLGAASFGRLRISSDPEVRVSLFIV